MAVRQEGHVLDAGAVAETLAGWSDDRLGRLFAIRPDLADPPPADFTALAARASAWPSIQACLLTLDRCCEQLVEAMCLLPRPTTASALAALLGPEVRAADLSDALGELRDRALVLGEGEDLTALPGLGGLRLPAGLGTPLVVLLGEQTAATLGQIAGRLGVGAARTKAATLETVRETLADPARVAHLVETGPPGTVELARRMAIEHPTVRAPGGLYAPRDHTPIGWLANRGMAVPVSWDRAVMPAEVGLGLRGGRPFPDFTARRPPLELAPVDVAAVDAYAAERALRLVGDVAGILEAWGETPPKLLKAGGVGVRDLRRAAKATERTEVEVARIVELAGVAGLAAADITAGQALPTAAFDDWMALAPAARWARLAAAWLGSDRSLGLAGAIDTKDKQIPPLLALGPEPHAVVRRRLVVEALGGGGPGQAVDQASVRARAIWDRPAAWNGGPAPAAVLVSWAAEEAELLGLAAMDSLSTFGRLAAGGRLVDAEAALAERAPDVATTFVLQADLTAVAAGELAAPVRAELDLLADVESKGAATVRRFSEASLRRGFDAGRTAEEILDFLGAHASRGVPQPLAYLVADVGRRHGQARVGTATSYVRSDDASLLAEVLRAKRTAGIRLRQLAPTVLVSDADPATVMATLQAAGYLPAREQADGALVLARPAPRRASARTRGGELARTAREGGGRALLEEFDDLDELARVLNDPEALLDFGLAWMEEEGMDLAGLDLGDGLGELGGPPPPADPGALVARLRQGPPPGARRAAPPSPAAKSRATASKPPLPPCSPRPPELRLLDDDPEDTRPTAIAKGQAEVGALLELAIEEEWMVRIGYTNRKGLSTQLSVGPLELDGDQVLVECLPGWNARTLALARVEWARVMTEAEEDALL